jgi:hypothetical protein
MEENSILSEEELDEIVALALKQTTVDSVLAIIDDCKDRHIVTPPVYYVQRNIRPPGFLDERKHLHPIFRHSIRLITSQDDATTIFSRGFFDAISPNESLASFIIAIEYCDSMKNLDYLTEIVLEWIYESKDFFNHQEEILALFEKKRELIENRSG